MRVGGCKKISGCFIGLGGVPREVIPDAIKVDALPPGHKPFGIRAMKIEMPNSRTLQNLGPRLDSRNRCVHHDEPLNFVRVHRSIRISHHVADVMGHHESSVVSERGDHSPNILGFRFLVITAFRLG